MDNQHELQLVNGRFNRAEAIQLLNELAHSKIQHHMRRIGQHAGSEEDIKASEGRIRVIETDLRDMLRYVKTHADEQDLIDIEGALIVRINGR